MLIQWQAMNTPIHANAAKSFGNVGMGPPAKLLSIAAMPGIA
jgi:hypothetical protein